MPSFSVKPNKIAEIKAKANELILIVAPEWKQRNLIACGLEITDKALNGDTLTTEEIADRQAIKDFWALVKSIRTHSDQLEQNVTNGIAVDIETGWPT